MNTKISNDITELKPIVKGREPILKFNFPNLKIGIGEYKEGPTGCTVFHFLKGARVICDVRGGAPGVIGENRSYADSICFSGGTLYGFEAISGVTAELLKNNDYSSEWTTIPVVSGAIIYDYAVRNNTVYPDKELGRRALASAVEGKFPLGRQGAGISATVGKCFANENREFGGQGGVSLEVGDMKILVFVVVNALGAIVDESGRIVRGHIDKTTDKRLNVIEKIKEEYIKGKEEETNTSNSTTNSGNTTLTLVVTNTKWDQFALRQIGKQIHTSMSNVIQPFHALTDGDVLFMATTDEIEPKNITATNFGILVSDVAKKAVLSCFETNKE